MLSISCDVIPRAHATLRNKYSITGLTRTHSDAIHWLGTTHGEYIHEPFPTWQEVDHRVARRSAVRINIGRIYAVILDCEFLNSFLNRNAVLP
jgi:hypothetical protein